MLWLLILLQPSASRTMNAVLYIGLLVLVIVPVAIVKNASFTSSSGLSEGTSLILGNQLGEVLVPLNLVTIILLRSATRVLSFLASCRPAVTGTWNTTLSGGDGISPLILCPTPPCCSIRLVSVGIWGCTCCHFPLDGAGDCCGWAEDARLLFHSIIISDPILDTCDNSAAFDWFLM